MRLLSRHRLRAVIGAILALLLIATAVAAMGRSVYLDALRAQRQIAAATAALEASGLSISSREAQAVNAHLASADAALRALEGSLRGPLAAMMRSVPGMGHQVDAATDLVRASRLVTSRHQLVLSMMRDYISARDGAAGPERIALLMRFLAGAEEGLSELMLAVSEGERLLSENDSSTMGRPLSEIHAVAHARLATLRPLILAAWEASTVLPAILGVPGEKRYLVLALDDAEVRPMGGLIAAFATPRVADGHINQFNFRDILDIDRPQQDPYVAPPPDLAAHLLGDFSWQVADAGWWPDFAFSAREARRLYAIQTGDAHIDGTIAFTPALVDALLDIVGPVEIPEAGIIVRPGETYLVSLEQVEVLNQGPDRKQFLARLASEVVERLYALSIDQYTEVVAALDGAGRRRQLQLSLDDAVHQAWLTDLGWYKPFEFPDEGDRLSIMEANVAPVSKLHVLVELDHQLQVVLQPDGNARERLLTTYTNRFGPDLPPELRAVDLAFRHGNLGSYQRRYLVPQATDISVRSDGHPPLTAPERVAPELGSLSVANYQLIRPGVTRIETAYLAPQVVRSANPARMGTYRLSFIKQAGRDTDKLEVRVTVPVGTVPMSWTPGGSRDGRTVTFTTTTEFDHLFEVTYGTE